MIEKFLGGFSEVVLRFQKKIKQTKRDAQCTLSTNPPMQSIQSNQSIVEFLTHFFFQIRISLYNPKLSNKTHHRPTPPPYPSPHTMGDRSPSFKPGGWRRSPSPYTEKSWDSGKGQPSTLSQSSASTVRDVRGRYDYDSSEAWAGTRSSASESPSPRRRRRTSKSGSRRGSSSRVSRGGGGGGSAHRAQERSRVYSDDPVYYPSAKGRAPDHRRGSIGGFSPRAVSTAIPQRRTTHTPPSSCQSVCYDVCMIRDASGVETRYV